LAVLLIWQAAPLELRWTLCPLRVNYGRFLQLPMTRGNSAQYHKVSGLHARAAVELGDSAALSQLVSAGEQFGLEAVSTWQCFNSQFLAVKDHSGPLQAQ
jgi:hypothetical protein